MSISLLLEIIQLAAGVIKAQTGPKVDSAIDEGVAIARIVAAGRQAYLDHTGEPLDETTIKEQARIE